MATPSSKYNVINTVTIGSGINAVQRDVTDTYKNIYPRSNVAFDKTIWYTKTKCKDILHAGVPTIGGSTHVEYLTDDGTDESYEWWNSATGTGKMRVYDLKFTPYQETDAEVGYTLGYYSSGATGNYWWGANAAQENVLGSLTPAIVRNWKYNENVLSVSNISAYNRSEFEEFIENYDATNPPATFPPIINVPLADLIANPDNYLVRSFRLGGCHLWNATQNKYVAYSQQFPVFNIDLKANGIGATGVNALYEQFFVSQGLVYRGWSPYQILCSSNSVSTFKPNGNRSFSTNIPLGLINDTNFYHYSLGMKSANYKVIINRQAISDVLDSIVIPSGQTQTTIADRYVSFDKLTDDANHVVYGAGLMAGGKSQSRTWLTSYNWTPVILYKGSFTLKVLASFGMYISADATMTTATPDTLNNTPNIYLGEMDKNGYTTGRLIPWTELDKYEGYNKGGTDINPDFDPEGGGGGGEDKYDLHDDTLPNVHPNSGLGSVQGRWFYTNDPQTIGNISELYTDADPVASWSTAQKVLYLSQTLDKVKDYGKDALVTAISFPFSLQNANGINIQCSGSTIDWIRVATEVFDLVPDHDTFGEVTQVNLVTKSKGAPITGYNPILNAGSFDIRPYGNDLKFIDFEPYTTIQLHLPFVGWVPLSCSQVMGKTIYVEYHVDLWTATAVAYVLLKNGDITTAIANYPCTIGTQIPIDKTQYANYMSAMLDCMTAVTATAASAGMGNAFGTIAGIADIGASIANGITSACNPQMSQVGSRGSAAEVFSSPLQTAVAIYRPEIVVPDNYGHTVGFACEKDATLSSLSGYTVCSGVDTSGIDATDSEKARLKAILESGFYA